LASLPEARGRPRIIELPLTEHTISDAGVEPRSLGEVLRESAELLFQSQRAEDPTIRESAVDLAIRSLRAAAAVVDGRAAQAKPACRVLVGPWSGPAEESPQPQA
jgi:hypothetical protein